MRAASDAHVEELRSDRTVHLRELGEARIRVQDLEAQLGCARAQVRAGGEAMDKLRGDHEEKVREQVAEAERVMRDHVAEADGSVLLMPSLLRKQGSDVSRHSSGIVRFSNIRSQIARTLWTASRSSTTLSFARRGTRRRAKPTV